MEWQNVHRVLLSIIVYFNSLKCPSISTNSEKVWNIYLILIGSHRKKIKSYNNTLQICNHRTKGLTTDNLVSMLSLDNY
jgi:hypothetical protein